jgi:uncharacterized protein YndB with AHSA1/START domain
MTPQQTDLTIRKSALVVAPPERAFEVFTEGIATWWPLETHAVELGKNGRPPETVVFETGPEGRIYERMTTGEEAHWANVAVWDPLHRLVLSWQVNPDTPAPTEIEVRFTPDGEGTRVDFEHRGWERLGDLAEESAAGYGGAEGWAAVLARYFEAIGTA